MLYVRITDGTFPNVDKILLSLCSGTGSYQLNAVAWMRQMRLCF
jgi:hypothetical protein